MQPVKNFGQRIRGDVVYPVERADRGVDRAVQVKLRRVLTQKQRRAGKLRRLLARLHQHIHRRVGRDHLVAAPRKLAGERSGTAAEVEQEAEFAPVAGKLRLVKLYEFGIRNIAGQFVIVPGEGAVAAHLSSSFMRSNTMA